MNQKTSKRLRVLAIALTALGFGFVVLEGHNLFVASGGRRVRHGDKNMRYLAKAEKLVDLYQPDVLVLQDVMAKGSRRAPRIKKLHGKITKLAMERSLKVALISEKELRSLLLGDPKGTKQEMAEKLAQDFPDELALRLPPKRKPWKSEDCRMAIFDAVALARALRMKNTASGCLIEA